MTSFANEFEKFEEFNKFDEFIDEAQTRHLYFTLSSDEPPPSMLFSKACNESWFLLALQNVPRDEWMNLENKLYWQYLHIGSEEPN